MPPGEQTAFRTDIHSTPGRTCGAWLGTRSRASPESRDQGPHCYASPPYSPADAKHATGR